jgi:hypothetical protein
MVPVHTVQCVGARGAWYPYTLCSVLVHVVGGTGTHCAVCWCMVPVHPVHCAGPRRGRYQSRPCRVSVPVGYGARTHRALRWCTWRVAPLHTIVECRCTWRVASVHDVLRKGVSCEACSRQVCSRGEGRTPHRRVPEADVCSSGLGHGNRDTGCTRVMSADTEMR